jgi:hypothetical protein
MKPAAMDREQCGVDQPAVAVSGPCPVALDAPPLSASDRVYLWVECATLFAVLPLMLAFRPPGSGIFLFLWSAAVICLTLLVRDASFDRRRLWNWGGVGTQIGRVLGLFAVGVLVGVALTWLFVPDRLFAFPLERTRLWLAVMMLYPVLSVVPQNVVYRAFIFHRYARLMPSAWSEVRQRWTMIALSAVAFSWAHVVFWNLFALGVTLLGGVLFAYTYQRSRSVAAASVEHALYGCGIFTLGLGVYLYHGAVGR